MLKYVPTLHPNCVLCTVSCLDDNFTAKNRLISSRLSVAVAFTKSFKRRLQILCVLSQSNTDLITSNLSSSAKQYLLHNQENITLMVLETAAN